MGWGCYPAWGPYHGSYGAVAGRYGAAAWGPGGWAATTGNVYHRWGATAAVTRGSAGYNGWTGNSWSRSAGMSYNSRTGTLAAGQRAMATRQWLGMPRCTVHRGVSLCSEERHAEGSNRGSDDPVVAGP